MPHNRYRLGDDVRLQRGVLNHDTTADVERGARGIGAVFSSGIKRSDQGGSGSFEPASVV